MLDVSERLGVHQELVNLCDEKGKLSHEKVEEAVEKVDRPVTLKVLLNWPPAP